MNHDQNSIREAQTIPSIVAQILRSSKLTRCHRAQADLPYWRGADVTIRPPGATSARVDSVGAPSVAVATIHADTLTWLFLSLRDAFSSELDFSNKFEFYGRLAEAATRHLSVNPNETEDDRPLLLAVVVQALQLSAETRFSGEATSTETPPKIERCGGMSSDKRGDDLSDSSAQLDRN